VSSRFSGAIASVATVLIAFGIAGLAVLVVGANPLTVYKSLFIGAGFDWPFQFLPGNPFGVVANEFPLQSTLVAFSQLVLVGLAVAFAFRCGLFNIGGQGQFWAGAVAAIVVATHVGGAGGTWLAAIAAAVAGALWAGLAGSLKAFRGAHEVISTIMLNWIAIFGTKYLVGTGGPFTDASSNQPESKHLTESSMYPQVWGLLQPVRLGILVALVAVVVYWVVLERTTLGYSVRAVGFNSEGARFGGVSVRRATVLSMAIAGLFSGLAGADQILGVSGKISSPEVFGNTVGFTGIAVALLGRNKAVGVVLSALLFAALASGSRQLSGEFSSSLARSLADVIQGIIILGVGGEAVVRWALTSRRTRPAEPPGPTVVEAQL
jgi:general nucleoside transport system permease protein